MLISKIKFGVVNQASVIDARSAALMTRACRTQLQRHIAPAWFRVAPQVTQYKDLPSVPADTIPMVLLDNSDEAGALGYHDETPDGRPYGRIFAKTVLDYHGTLLDGANSVSVTLSHELAEAFCDLNINTWADDGGYGELAWEVGDPVEDTAYTINAVNLGVSVPVAVSNFVLMSYFDKQSSAGIYDYMGVLTAPWSMTSGGYQIIRSGGKVTQKFGERMPDWKKETKRVPASRTYKREESSAA